MGRLTGLTLLAILAVLMSQLKISYACSCYLQHPQTHFCESDFVAVIRSKEWQRVGEYEVSYRVKLHRIFKATPKARIALESKPLRLWSPSSENMCGQRFLNPGKTWLVTGRIDAGKLRLSLCNLAIEWSEVTPRQRKGFRHFYRQGCGCPISYTEWWKKGAVLESAGGKRCLWESAPGPQDCQERHGICMLGSAGCSWVPSVAYNKCIMKHQRDRVQQRAREP